MTSKTPDIEDFILNNRMIKNSNYSRCEFDLGGKTTELKRIWRTNLK